MSEISYFSGAATVKCPVSGAYNKTENMDEISYLAVFKQVLFSIFLLLLFRSLHNFGFLPLHTEE